MPKQRTAAAASDKKQSEAEAWSERCARMRESLRPFYPDQTAPETPGFGHPSDGWANALIYEAAGALSTARAVGGRPDNESLIKEQTKLAVHTARTIAALETMTATLRSLINKNEVDLDDLQARIEGLHVAVVAAGEEIKKLRRARTPRDLNAFAAREVAIRCLRLLKDEGGDVAATAVKDLERYSPAVLLLKALGDELGLVLAEPTWKRAVQGAQEADPGLRAQSLGAVSP